MVADLYEKDEDDAHHEDDGASVLSDLEADSTSMMEKQKQRRRKRKQKRRLKVQKDRAEKIAEEIAQESYMNSHKFVISAPIPRKNHPPGQCRRCSGDGKPQTSTPKISTSSNPEKSWDLEVPRKVRPRSTDFEIPMEDFKLPVFGDGPRGHRRPDSSGSSDISSNEDRNILNSVRFSHLVDSRRISKDYYSRLQQQEVQAQQNTR